METLKRPMNTAEFFTKICDILTDKGMMPSILDYALPVYNPVLITTSEFEFKNNLDYGSSEGVYLDLWLEIDKDDKTIKAELGTFKTLLEDYPAMEAMGKLLAGFIFEGRKYVNKNLDNFNWQGWEVYAFDDNGKKAGFSYSCSSMDSAIVQKDKLMEYYPKVVIRDNETRNEKFYGRSKVACPIA